MVIQLLAGMFLGTLISFLVWAVISKTVKSRNEKARLEREKIMHSMGEIWVEIDSLISSYKSGAVKEREFHDTFSSKIDTINRLMKPNLHLFDVYYVKYIENLAGEYKRVAGYEGAATAITAGTAADSEMETNYSMVEQEPSDLFAAGEAEKEEPDTDTGDAEAKKLSSTEEADAATVQKDAAFESGEPAGPVEKADDTSESTGGESSFELADTFDDEEATFEMAVPAVEPDTDLSDIAEKPSSVSEKKETDNIGDKTAEITPQSEEAVDVFEQVTESAPVKTDDTSSPAESDAEGISADSESEEASFEVALDEKDEKPDSSDTLPSPPIAETERSAASEGSSDLFSEEDFTMETLMDVDINEVNPYIETAPETVEMDAAEVARVQSREDTPKEDGLEVVIASNASHTEKPDDGEQVSPEAPSAEISVETITETGDSDDAIPEETTYTHVDELEKKTGMSSPEDAIESEAEEFQVAIPSEDERDSFFEDSTDLVTGDDIADKIAALETPAAGKSVKKPAKKSRKKTEESSKKSTAKQTVAKKKAKNPSKSTQKSPTKSKTKRSKKEDGITGNDVAEQIDSLFGLH